MYDPSDRFGADQDPHKDPGHGARRPIGPGAPEYGRRIVARLVDAVIAQVISMVLLVIALLGLFVFLFTTGPDIVDGPGPLLPAFLAVSFVAWWAYEAVCLKLWGATPGKRTMGLKVVPASAVHGSGRGDAAAGGLPWSRAAVRALVWSVPLLLSWNIVINLLSAALWLANGLWPLHDHPMRQALHDKAAGTRVVDAG